jgi:hypothetical protein
MAGGPTVLALTVLGRATRVLKGGAGGLVTSLGKKTFTAFGTLWVGGFFTKAVVTLFELLLLDNIAALMSNFVNTIWAGTLLVLADNNPKLAINAVGVIATEITNQTPIAGQLAAQTIEQITGISIDKEKLFAASTGIDRQAYKQVMGDEFTQVVSQMLNVNLAKQDFATRTGFVGSFSNLSSYFGTNLDFQLRSLTISTISSMFGWQSLRHLEGLHQSINWAFGFGWLSWSVLSNAMDVTVNAGIKRFYNSQVKPHDLSSTQANKALIRRMIGPAVWNQIHDNAGMRDDARNWQIELEFKQPSVSDLKTGYRHDEILATQLDDILIKHELTPEGAALTKSEILNGERWKLEETVASEKLRHLRQGWESSQTVSNRLKALHWHDDWVALAVESHATERIFHLREAVTREHLKFLRHGLETQEDTRTWLASQNWSEEEIELAFEANRLEQKAQKIVHPKHLSLGEVAVFVANGIWDPLKGQAYLVNLGYAPDDTNTLLGYAILQHAVNLTPKKVRDACETDSHIVSLLSAALTATQVLDPLSILKQSDYFRLVTCAIGNLRSTTTPAAPPPIVGPPAPQFLTAVAGTGTVSLSWQPMQGLVDYQVYRRKIGDGFFGPVGTSSPATSHIDTGLVKGEIYIYVVRSRLNGVESANSNEVQIQGV